MNTTKWLHLLFVCIDNSKQFYLILNMYLRKVKFSKYGTITNTATPSLGGLVCNGNEGRLHTSQSSRTGISPLDWGLLTLCTYLWCSVSSIKTSINTWLAKVWTAIDRLSVIWKLDVTDKINRSFFPSSSGVDTAIWMHYMDVN